MISPCFYYIPSLSVYVEAKHLHGVLRYLEEQSLVAHWWRIGIKLEQTLGDLEVIKSDSDSVEYRAAALAMLNKWLISGRATRQALVEAVRVVK